MNTLDRNPLLPVILALTAFPELLGRGRGTPSRPRLHEHECAGCQAKLPPGRQGRKCQGCCARG